MGKAFQNKRSEVILATKCVAEPNDGRQHQKIKHNGNHNEDADIQYTDSIHCVCPVNHFLYR